MSVISWVAELELILILFLYGSAFKKTKAWTCEIVGRFWITTRGQVCLEVGIFVGGDGVGA